MPRIPVIVNEALSHSKKSTLRKTFRNKINLCVHSQITYYNIGVVDALKSSAKLKKKFSPK